MKNMLLVGKTEEKNIVDQNSVSMILSVFPLKNMIQTFLWKSMGTQ